MITYLPDYPNKEWARKATVAQLVDHSSGLGDIFTKRFWDSNTMRFRTPKDFIEFFGNDPLQFEPGKGKKYSNYGYVVLGAVIEAASGESYFDYIQKHIFDAVPMRGTGFFEFRKPIPDVALGHTRRLPDGTESKEWMETRNQLARHSGGAQLFLRARPLSVRVRAARRKARQRSRHALVVRRRSERCGRARRRSSRLQRRRRQQRHVDGDRALRTSYPPAADNFAEHVYNALSR